jgi:integrase
MPGKQAKVVTPPMLKRMLRHVSSSSSPARDRAMIMLSVKAGLRACEIAGLDWSMVLDAQGRVSGTIHVRDVIAKKRGGRRIPMHPDLRRALEKLALTVEPVGPVIRSYLRGLLVAFRTAQLHHHGGAERSPLRLQLAGRAAARRAPLHRNDRTVHRRRHLGAAEAGRLRVAR